MGAFDADCLGVLPLRLMAADDEEDIWGGNDVGGMWLMVWVKLDRCHCQCRKSFAMSRQFDRRRLFDASPCPSLATNAPL